MRVIYHLKAEEELVEAARLYERKAPGLGSRFLTEFDAAITQIQQAPDRWRIVEGDLRRFVMRRFPFGIYYRIEGDALRILVVKHHRRRPGYGSDRFNP